MNPKCFLRAIMLAACIMLAGNAVKSQVSINIYLPAIVNTNCVVNAEVRSTYQLDSVYATVMGRRINLVYVGTNTYSGTISLAGLAEGQYTFTATAKDIFNNQSSSSASAIYDIPPKIIVETPLDYSTARPKIRVKAKCQDSAPGCAMQLYYYDTAISIDSLDRVLDLTAADGNFYMLVIIATDVKGQKVQTDIPLYVESSPYLKEYYVTDDFIADFKDGKLLTAKGKIIDDPATGAYEFDHEFRNYKIKDMVTGVETSIPSSRFYTAHQRAWTSYPYQEGNNGIIGKLPFYLTPGGAVLYSYDTLPVNSSNAGLHYWNGSSLKVLSTDRPSQGNLSVAGNYAAWNWTKVPDEGLGFANLLTGDTTLWGRYSGLDGYTAVAENGLLIAIKSNGTNNLVKILNGNITSITDSLVQKRITSPPFTDGKRVVYGKDNHIMLYDGAVNIDLSPYTSSSVIDYGINKNYVAFTRQGPTGQSQLWIRDTSGNNKQLTFYNFSSYFEALGENGDVMFYNYKRNDLSNATGQRRFLADTSGNIKAVGSANIGRPFYNNGWYVAIGRTIFKIDTTGIIPITVSSFNLTVQNGISNKFNPEDFTNNFNGSGVLIKIKISELPKKGTLSIGSNSIHAGDEINITDVKSLTYRSNTGYVGPDSIKWNASNNDTYAASDALVRINVVPTIYPVVTGMKTEYCNAFGPQKGKIANLPPVSTGITVTVRLDSTTILTVGPDSTFTFNPDNLVPNNHKITVTYNSAAGKYVFTQNFLVRAAVTPNFFIAATASVVTNLQNSVTIGTIGIVGDGGGLWTFSQDSTFNTFLSQGPGGSWTFSPQTYLVNGDNWFYVRLTTGVPCYTSLTVVKKVNIKLALPAPPNPFVTGTGTSYCSNAGVQKGKITNLPAPGNGITTSVKLDGNALTLQASDTSFTFNTNTLSAGTHALEVTFANVTDTKTTTINFTVNPPATPDVNLSSSVIDIGNPSDPVVITATAAAGGGTAPAYLFATDRNFTNVLQAEGSSNVLNITGADLSLGDNMIYVRMRSNYPCATASFAIDSVFVLRSARVGLTDPDFPGQVIACAPNPVKAHLTIYGLQASKTYTISLLSQQGTLLRKIRIVNQHTAAISIPGLAPGTYMVNIFDETKGRVIGTIRIVKL